MFLSCLRAHSRAIHFLLFAATTYLSTSCIYRASPAFVDMNKSRCDFPSNLSLALRIRQSLDLRLALIYFLLTPGTKLLRFMT